jgi:HSP20 family protein
MKTWLPRTATVKKSEKGAAMPTSNWLPNGLNDWSQLQREMNRLFNRFGDRVDWPTLAAAYPPVNVWEDKEKLSVEAELPGMQLDKLEIYVSEGNQLTIQGERPQLSSDKGTWHRQERGVGKFSRTITLPVLVDAEKVEARFENGILHVALPKSETAKPRQIKVKGG